MKSPRPRRPAAAFTLMELMVVLAIIIVLASIAFPVFIRIRTAAHKADANRKMQQLASAVASYTAQHDGRLPNEDTTGRDSWESAKEPEAENAWYIALPRMLNVKSLGDFVREGRPADFYTRENLLFLPGADYPDRRRMIRPYFALAINTKLIRKNHDGIKPALRQSQIPFPNRTVLFLEQGLPGEPKAHDTISNGDYDGSPKGSAKSFVARYAKRGLILFVDGHVDEVSAKQLLTSTGEIIWSPEATAGASTILWSPDPNEDPNIPVP